MNYITLSPIFGSRRSQWIFCFRAEHLCFSPWFREQFFSLKLVYGWFTVTHFVLAAGPTSKASMHHVVWAVPLQTLGLKLHWVWGTRLIPGPHQSASWHQNWSVTAFLVKVHPYTREKSHVLFYFQFSLSFVLLSIMVYMFSLIFDAFWASFGLKLWGFFFLLLFFKQNKQGWSVGWVCFPEGCACCTGRKIISHLSCPWLPSLKVKRDEMVQKVLWKLCCLTLPLVCDPSE